MERTTEDEKRRPLCRSRKCVDLERVYAFLRASTAMLLKTRVRLYRHAFTVAITFEMTAQVVKVTVSSMTNMSFFLLRRSCVDDDMGVIFC